MRREAVVAGVALALALATASCGGTGGSGGDDGRVGVVASFYPLAEVAQRVGGDRVRVTNLTPAGAEPHDLELNSRDLDRIEAATIVVYLGGGFQPALERALSRAGGPVVDLLDPDLGLLGGTHDERDRRDGADPHVWLDPTLMKRIAERLGAALAEADPAGATTYADNARAYGADLDVLHREYQEGLARCDRRTFVTSHASFGYLARRYDLTQQSISGLAPEAEPDPRRLADLAATVRSTGTTTVFYETLVSPKVAQALAREAGVKTDVLDPIEGLGTDDLKAGKTYASVMRENLAALRSALGCR